MTLTLPRLLFVFTALLLSACTSQKSSPERHAKHAIYQLAREDFSPEMRTQIPDSIKASIPFFDQFYKMGKADRAKGLTQQQAQQQEAYFRSPEFLSDMGKKGQFINQQYSVDNP